MTSPVQSEASSSKNAITLPPCIRIRGNPKSILSWIASMSLGFRADAPAGMLPVIVDGCAILGVIVFGGYAHLERRVMIATRPSRMEGPIVRAVQIFAANVDLALFKGAPSRLEHVMPADLEAGMNVPIAVGCDSAPPLSALKLHRLLGALIDV
ncbi:hypothetical protein [Paenirhodobacter populi]|uniref:hypothetical protein n=1 Tax=Paenirhodobacter populi TaxID=2306993 RepID=UPI0019D423A5|nr:hypothetical protein [Sinirhodobacter populi]